ncbi:HpcH/HpaI aldolase/citrate lyase family protein [Nesterenkonia aerolata]|uniref:CoA ester lyase n=1 Tax=Nesterenkonia aerolata TaxID=3074079 RepID=A0ABU2DR47_9MICC|nr:CoA ester lyase [Nesterenkonia sp. LY-0111]MDR8018866.1 CoA ester lyase [Nesterenkonia sp. LY-0111]
MTDRPPFDLGPSLLFCPGDRPERFAKAAERADAVILDLEDAVAASDKSAARAHLAAHFGVDGPAGRDRELRHRTVVRVNAGDSGELAADLQMLVGTGVEFVMLAKTESAEDVAQVASVLGGVGVIALCETAAGVVAAEEIAAHPATVALMWGAEDLIASIGGSSSRLPDGTYRDVARQARSRVLLAAAAYGAAGIDAIYADIADVDGLAAESADAVGSGFAAKACIHPSQVTVIRSAYAPTEEELEHARALLEEVSQHGGAFQFRGAMVDAPLIRHAERVVQRAEATGAD